MANPQKEVQTSLNAITSRFPRWREILPIFSVFCFFCFSWSLYRMFWYVPSWLEYLTLWKVLVIACYILAFALIESAVMTGLVSIISIFFPARLFKERFVLMGSVLAALISISAFLLQRKINLVYRLEIGQIVSYSTAMIVLVIGFVLLMSWIFSRLPWINKMGDLLAERMTVFAYLYAPLGLLGLIVVLLRNFIGF